MATVLPCLPTCADPQGYRCNGQSTLAVPDIGCMCKEGTLSDGDHCSPVADCGCVLQDGKYLEVRHRYFIW